MFDHFFEKNGLPRKLHEILLDEFVIYVDTTNEPTTTLVNSFHTQVLQRTTQPPLVIIGIGGGATMDVAKAVSNLLTNGGMAEDYQGWDLVREPGIYIRLAFPHFQEQGLNPREPV